jgi:hypothetical protein
LRQRAAYIEARVGALGWIEARVGGSRCIEARVGALGWIEARIGGSRCIEARAGGSRCIEARVGALGWIEARIGGSRCIEVAGPLQVPAVHAPSTATPAGSHPRSPRRRPARSRGSIDAEKLAAR